MRKIILIVILALAVLGSYVVVANGIELGTLLNIKDFEAVEIASKEVDTLISQLVNVNDIEYKSKQATLDSAIRSYKSAKEEYEEMAAIINDSADDEEINMSMVDIYDVDFLWTTIGNYATEEGIVIKMDMTQSITSATSSTDEYTMCDLKFTVSGDYNPIIEFIYHLAEDNKLNFSISNFEMAKGGENLQATFTVKSVPINNATLSELQTSIDTSTVNEGNVVTDNTTTNTVTNTTDNTNTTNNNTVN